MRSSLVIVDMQKYFRSAREDAFIYEVLREVKKAKKKKMLIIVLEYDGIRTTMKEIKKALIGYSNKIVLTKYTDSGGYVIKDHVLQYQKIDDFYFCGVNLEACVFETVRTLNSFGYKKESLQIILPACNSSNDLTKLDWVKIHKYGTALGEYKKR